MLAKTLPLLTIFPLHIFPESGLSRSIITTVFLGLVVMVFFNEAFGWVFSGLVVPGYLAPILIIQPWSAGVIVVEALLTHLCVRFSSDWISRAGPRRLGPWREFFGRDRFFAYLMFGVLVRALGEGWLFHALGAALNKSLALSIDYRNNFYSIGLIVVPLLANMFWKPGVKSGLVPIGTAIGVTYAAIRFILMPYTNFSISSFELTYGYYATSFLGNAKAYIILLTAAYMASRANLRYGWDYNGILVPSLLALAWFRPAKVATSLGEAIVILHAARWIAQRQVMSAVTIEGGRRLLLCFSVGFALKMLLGFGAGALYPGFDAGELYGFGYLLPSLIANKMNQKNSIGIVLRPLLQTSIVGAVTGTLASAALLAVLPVGGTAAADLAAGESPAIATSEADLFGTILADKARLVRRDDRKGMDRMLGREPELFRAAIALALEAQEHPPGSPEAERRLREAQSSLRPLGYLVRKLRTAGALYYYICEAANAPGKLHGWGIYAFDAAPSTDLVLEVPRPFADWKAVECGAALTERLRPRALFVAGAHPLASREGGADALAARGSPFQIAHLLVRRRDVVQVRGDPDAATAARGGPTDPEALPPAAAAPRPAARLFYERELPRDLRLRDLEAIVGEAPELVLPGMGRYERMNLQRETATKGFAALVLSPEGARRAIALVLGGQRLESTADVKNIDGYLLSWIDEEKEALASSGSEAYDPPKPAELIFMDEEVLAPLVRIQIRAAAGADPDDEQLREVARAASQVGYELVRYTYRFTGARFLILREPDDAPAAPRPRRRRYRGTFILRLGKSAPYAIEVPYPVTDYHTFEAGARLFELLGARALIYAGASRFANEDGSADVANPRHIESFFQLAHQVLVRENGGDLLSVSVRGFNNQSSDPGRDVILSTGREVKRREECPPLVRRLSGELARLGADVGIFDGSRETLRYKGGRTAQWAYCDVAFPGTFVYCWLSSEFREAFRDRLPENEPETSVPEIGVERARGNLLAYVEAVLAERRRREVLAANGAPAAPPPGPEQAEDARLAIDLLRRFDRSENVVYLERAKEAADRAGGALAHFVDTSSNREYLVFAPPLGMPQVLFVANLHPGLRAEAEVARDRPDLFAAVAEFVSKGYESLLLLERGAREGPR
jgi:hypothetical protein